MVKQSEVQVFFLGTPFGGIHDGLLGNTPRSRVAFVIVLIGLLCIRSR